MPKVPKIKDVNHINKKNPDFRIPYGLKYIS